jgi:hypothetical protein
VPVAERPQSDRVSAMSTVGLERRRIRTGRAAAFISPRGPLVVVSVAVVFACFFAIGRATDSGSAAPTESSSLPAASLRVAIPVHLSAVPAIEALLAAPRLTPAPSSSQPPSTPAFSRARATAPAASRTQKPSLQPAPSIASTPQEAPVRQVRPAPPPSAPSTSRSTGGEGGASKRSSGGGGTFESSG